MAAIKEIPTNFRVYYTSMRNAYTQKRNAAYTALDDLTLEEIRLYREIGYNISKDKDYYDINLESYDEFVDNAYKTGKFLSATKGFLTNRNGGYELISSRFDLYKLAKLQKDIYFVKKDIEKYSKVLNLSIEEYKNILKAYYYKVHEKMIIDGCGYVLGHGIGWICINRCHVTKVKPLLDYNETKKNKAKLLAEGKKLLDMEEKKWCEERGIEYTGVDYRIYKNEEYVYEVPLINSTLPNGSKLKFITSNYYSRKLRDKTNDELIALCDGDKYKICQLDVDIKAKLDLCLKVDSILFSKFIRNEYQQPCKVSKATRQSR